MKKKCILALILGAAFMAQGCGFTEGTDAVVTVVDSTPTPEPTEAPEETATPTPEATAEADSTAAADPTAQAAATEQTPSGINVQAQDATYYAVEGEFTFRCQRRRRVRGRCTFRRISEMHRNL